MKTIIRTQKHSEVKGIIVCLMLFIGCVSCTDNFSELNTPDDTIFASDIDEARLGKIFATAQRRGYSAREGGLSFQLSENLFADEYSQYFSTTEANFPSAQFVVVGSWNNAMFDHFFANVATQLDFVEDYTEENEMPVENAIAKVWRVHAYHRMTDFYGPMMYSEVGNAETTVPYDAQEDIYMDFFDTLDEAVEVLSGASGISGFAQNDMLYAGNIEQWHRFANSLRLRLATRISYVEPEIAQQEAEKAVAAGVIEDNMDNALMLTTENSLHGYPAITYIDEFRSTSTLVNTMVSYDDPRISLYLDEVEEGGGYRGIRSGLPVTEKGQSLNPDHSRIGLFWRPIEVGGSNPDIHVLTATEVYFLRAEGELRNWDMGGTEEQFYNEGIRASMSEYRFNISDDAIEAYITNTDQPIAVDDQWNSPPMTDIPVLYQPGADEETRLEQIITQKWVALYPDGGFEAWAERRRTGYPVGYAIIESLNPDVDRDELMRRLTFTANERSNNGPAVEDAIDKLGGPDSPATRVWWDARPLSEFPAPVEDQNE